MDPANAVIASAIRFSALFLRSSACLSSAGFRGGGEESGYQGRNLGLFFEHEQVAAGDDVQRRVRYAARQDPAVDERHDRVVVPGENQRGLGELPQPRHAGPAADRIHLAQVPAQRRPPEEAGQRTMQQGVRVAARRPAVHPPGDATVIVRLVVPPRGRQRQQDARRAGNPSDARAGRGKNEPAD